MYKTALGFACLAIRYGVGYSHASPKVIDSLVENRSSRELLRGRDEYEGAFVPTAMLASLLLSQVQPPTRSWALSRHRSAAPIAQAGQSTDWELDFFSRPVQGANGKKLWELLVTDSEDSFRHVEPVPSNCVNSRELRTRVQQLIDGSAVKPKSIKFFRSEMKNMINIGLEDLADVKVVPSRTTYALMDWLDERERDVYPLMPGYSPPKLARGAPMAVNMMPMSDSLLPETLDIVQMPLSEFLAGGRLVKDSPDFGTIRHGSLCRPTLAALEAPPGTMISGLVLNSERADWIASVISTKDIASVGAEVTTGKLFIQAGMDVTWAVTQTKDPKLKKKFDLLESSKRLLGGFHFLGINKPSSPAPVGFWTLRDARMNR
jgi:hypothetical protein